MSQKLKPTRRAALHASVLAACLAFGSAANAGITFAFDYGAAGTNPLYDNALGQTRKDALTTAGSLFSSYFGSLFTNAATIDFAVEGTDQSCAFGCTLAYAGSERVLNSPGFGGGEVVRQKLQGGGDLNGAANDGVVGVNWGAPWELDPNVAVATPNLGNMDFFATLFHEFTHALGFASVMSQTGSDFTNTGPLVGGIDVAGYWNKFDQFKTDCAGGSLIDHLTGLTDSVLYDPASTRAMCLNGANAMAANGGNEVALYAPGAFAPGSSGSHLDGVGVNLAAMMKYDRGFGVDEARTYNAIEIGVLKDLGYTAVVAGTVPEPGSIALVLAALAGLTGLTISRRKA